MNKVGLILDAKTINDIKDLAFNAEQANFHSVWATELYRTSFQQISAAASVTNKIKLGTAVALAFVRSPLITALTALDLDEFSNGRFILGLGTGAKRTNENFHGISYGDKPVTRIKECITLIKSLISGSHKGDIIDFEGEFYDINTKGYKRAFKPVRTSIPVYLAGIGTNMVKASSKYADGYIGHVVCSLKYLEKNVLPQFEVSDDTDFTKCSIITCAVSKDLKKAREHAKATIAFYAMVKTYEAPFKLHGFTEQTKLIRNAYFKKDVKSMINHVTDEMVDTFAVVGDKNFCEERINEYRKFLDLPILSVPHYFIDFKDVKNYQMSLIEAFAS